jgi:hypothetical protein
MQGNTALRRARSPPGPFFALPDHEVDRARRDEMARDSRAGGVFISMEDELGSIAG